MRGSVGKQDSGRNRVKRSNSKLLIINENIGSKRDSMADTDRDHSRRYKQAKRDQDYDKERRSSSQVKRDKNDGSTISY